MTGIEPWKRSNLLFNAKFLGSVDTITSKEFENGG